MDMNDYAFHNLCSIDKSDRHLKMSMDVMTCILQFIKIWQKLHNIILLGYLLTHQDINKYKVK